MAQARQDLDQFFHPDGVAILGRVDRDGDARALLDEYRSRYGTDRVYLVNPKGGSIGDVPVYESVVDIPDPVGLAIISVGPRFCIDAIEECGRKGIPYALIFTAGFSEVGPEGAALEDRLASVAREHGIRVFGPNTNTNAFERMPEIAGLRGGKIGLLTQSGHNGRPVVQGAHFGVGFSRWVPTGNEVDLEVADFLEYFAYDDETAVIAGYFEGFKNPTALRRALDAANANGKPVVALKIGSTAAGRRMASSHTGHLTGADAVVDGLFAQHGVTRVRDLDELLETAALFAKLPPGTGPNVCLYSVSGGSGTLMAEIAETAGVPAPLLSSETQTRLHELIPDYLTVANPVDNGGQFLGGPQEHRLRALELIAADLAVDVIVVGITGALASMTDNFGADLLVFAPTAAKPVVVTWNSPKTDEQGFRDIVASGLPLFRSFRNCFAALRAYADYQQRANGFRVRVPIEPRAEERAAASSALSGDGTLDSASARSLLEAFDLPLVREALVTSASDLGAAAERIGWPVVMKLVSPDVPHKSDVGLVRLDVSSVDAATGAYEELVERSRSLDDSARVDGVVVQQQVSDGVEMIVGATHDPVLGPAVLVGTGGIFAEVLDDVAVRPLPLDADDAREMVHSLRGHALLAGARGRPPVDEESLVRVIVAVARLCAAAEGRLSELDLNPVLVSATGAIVVDWLAIAGEAERPVHP
ncbi:MAG: acetate--CoA ligase family protein [Acidimicrobiia bacterium]